MSRETTPIPFDEFSTNPASFFERVIRGNETVVVENEAGERIIIKPALTAKGRRTGSRKRGADREAFLSTAGGWKDLVDTDTLVEDIYLSRGIPSRPPIRI